MGLQFIYERSMTDIAEMLMKPAPTEEEENAQDADVDAEEQAILDAVRPESAKKAEGKQSALTNPPEAADKEGAAEDEVEEEQQDWLADVVENDFLGKAELLPPQDPEGQNVMVPDLILTRDRILELLERALETVCEWLIE